jgi:hypothetical protein
MSLFARILLRLISSPVLWFARRVLKYNRLEKLTLIDLGAPIADAITLYDDPIDSEPVAEFLEATRHKFAAGAFHEAVIVEWKGRVCLIVYWSDYADPNRDLKCMLDKYGEGIGWDLVEEGYLCFRKDGNVRLWCSAAPAIGVATTEYFVASNRATVESTP